MEKEECLPRIAPWVLRTQQLDREGQRRLGRPHKYVYPLNTLVEVKCLVER